MGDDTEGAEPTLGARLNWRVILDDPLPGSRNMALDHALTTTLREGCGVLRLYGFGCSTVSFGKNEPAAGLYSREEASRLGVDFVRRPTGGRAVLHDDELTYAVLLPERALGGPRVTYLRINEVLVRAMRHLGVDASASRTGGARPLDAGPCFGTPTRGEVVVGRRKLVGSAQARMNGALLQHGSVLMGGRQSVLDELAPGRAHLDEPATLGELIGPISVSEVIEAVLQSFESALGGSWRRGEYTPLEVDEATRLEESRYARDEWTWRR